MTYLLSCSECERTIPVETKDAGRTVSCECGAQLNAGTMRDIRQLPEAGQDVGLAEAARPAGRRWSGSQGGVFALGVVLTFAAAGYAGFEYLAISKLDLRDQALTDEELGDQTIDALTPFGAYETWKMLQKMGIGDKEKPQYMLNQETAAAHRENARIALYLAGLGLLVMVVAALALKPGRWRRGR